MDSELLLDFCIDQHGLDSARDLNCAPPYSTLNSDDSNAIVLAEKKKKRKKDNKRVETNKTPKLSKSQKKKLQKIQEEKEKALRFAKSIKTLEKYKLQEDAYSLMWSSRNMGQAESVREKRLREVQYAKAGLEVPDAVRPFKKRCSGNMSCETEADSDEIHPMDEIDKTNLLQPVATERIVLGDANRNDSLQPVVNKREMLSDAIVFVRSSQESVCGRVLVDAGDNNLSDNDNSMQRDAQNIMPASSGGSQKIYSGCDLYKTPETSISRLSNLGSCPAQRVPIAPMVVHVSRPKEVESKRKDLPIVMMEQEIMEAINEKISVIICGETGCGKTTQVPQFLFEAGFGSDQCSARSGIIGVTQPRRVAVLATAKRVAFELGLRLGKEVGFQVRHDKKVGDGCSIKFMTDGILLRELQSDLLLKRYSVIILDEAHERSLNTDILIGFLSRIIQERQRFYEEQQRKILSGERISPENKIYPLKLLLMSATLRVEDFISGTRVFRETPPVINVPTRQYPVTIHFSKKTETVDYIGQAYKKVLSIHKRLPPGGILVFVTGQREVEYLCQKLRKASREMVKSSHAEKSGEYVNLDGNYDIKEINEAFEMVENSSQQQTDRFSSYDGDHGELFENESDFSSDSGTDSDLEYCSDDADVFNQRTPKVDGNLEDVLGEDGSLASLRAAFNALAGENELNPDSDGKQSAPPFVDGSVQPIPSLGEKRGAEIAFCGGAMRVLPLYAMLPASSQLHVFEEVKEGERLVVVATNVAETSLTIPGIKYVVDTGREKVKIYNSSNGMESYEVQWISKASAAQRAGRAGRTGPGHCYRVYSSAVFNNIFPDFSTAEILKVPVDGVVLLMKSMGIDKVANFPFPTPPEPSSLVEAERTLRVLDALNSKGKLTPLGKAMARYPMSPRHSRMLLTVIQNLTNAKDYARANVVLAYTIAAAAALSLPNPFVMRFEGSNAGVDELKEDEKSVAKDGEKVLDKEEKMRRKKVNETAKASRAKYLNPTSDALTIANALQAFELCGSPGEFCNNNALHLKTMEEMSKLRKQLIQLVFNQSFSDSQQDLSWTHGTVEEVENAWRFSCSEPPLLLNEEEVLGKAICAGWADRVAKRTRSVSGLSEGERKHTSVRYQACMVKETLFLHRWSSLSRSAPEYLVYSELLHTKRPYIHGATSVKSDWLVKYASSLCTFSAPLTDPRPYYEPVTDQVLCWVVPTFGPHLWQLPLHSLPIKDDTHRVVVFAFSLLQGQVLPCLRSVQKFMAASPAIILRPEASGQRRVGILLNKLKARRKPIDSCAKLRETWNENPRELYSEIMEWFQEVFNDKFDALWAKMLHEVLLHPSERFPK